MTGRRVRTGALLALYAIGGVLGAPSGFGALFFLPYAGVGTVLILRRPRQSLGWLLLGLGWVFVLITQSVTADAAAFDAGTEGLGNAALALAGATLGSIEFLLIAVVAIVFPSGRLPTGRWTRPTLVSIAMAIAAILASASGPRITVNLWSSNVGASVRNPLPLLAWLPIWDVVSPDLLVLPVVALMAAAVGSIVIRARRATGVERQQFRWLAAALAFVVVAVVGGEAVGILVPGAAESGLNWLGAIVAFPCVPIAIGVAVLRYRLYDIDRIVSRTIGWALVTGITVATFGAVVVALSAALGGLTQGDTLAVAASTLVAASLFQPVRRRVQAAVDRQFDRGRYDADRTAEAFGERLRDRVDLEGLRGDLAGTVTDALRPRSTGLWIRSGSGGAE